MSRRAHPMILAAGSTVVAVALAFVAWRAIAPSVPWQTIQVDPDVEPERVVEGREPYVFDPVVGFRTPRGMTAEIRMTALDSTELQSVVRKTNNLGFVREDDLTGELGGPRVLVVGDSHTLGVVGTNDNLGPVLERRLRAHEGHEGTLVLNAGCGYYSLYQHVLRVRTLVDSIRPQCVVVVVFMGNDFLDLENRRVPFLDDDLSERPVDPNPPPETTSARRVWLELPDDDAVRYYMEASFWQGLNQAAYLHRQPDRIEALHRKALRCVELLEQLGDKADFEVVWMLLPSVDVVFPGHLRTASPRVEDVISSGVQRALFDWFAGELQRRGSAVVDLRPTFEADGRLSLYAADFHIWVEGHRLVAEQAEPLVLRLLDK